MTNCLFPEYVAAVMLVRMFVFGQIIGSIVVRLIWSKQGEKLYSCIVSHCIVFKGGGGARIHLALAL
jgi:hypothetical protein